jgi:hypothetical protein
LPNRFAINSARDILNCLATEQRRHATGKLYHFDSTPNIAARFQQSFAVLARVAAHNFFEVVLK